MIATLLTGKVKAAVKHALKVGYRHIDCATIYGNEVEVGQGIKEAMDEYNIPRLYFCQCDVLCYGHYGA